jgi:small subunit ribosomal protein S20
MPNTSSAKKRLRQSENANERNQSVKSRMKGARRAFFEAVEAGEQETLTKTYREYCSILDRAAKKGVIKKNTAARRKSRAADKVRATA